MTVRDFARAAKTAEKTASDFLRTKLRIYAETNKSQLLRLRPQDASAINATGTRQLERLAMLAEKPPERWTREDYALEKHALSCLKAVSPWLYQALNTPDPSTQSPDTGSEAPAELSDGL